MEFKKVNIKYIGLSKTQICSTYTKYAALTEKSDVTSAVDWQVA